MSNQDPSTSTSESTSFDKISVPPDPHSKNPGPLISSPVPLPISISETTSPDPIIELHAMFPDIDVAIIEDILHSHPGSDKEAAINSLLALSDPEYSAKQQPSEDEILARKLMEEDVANARSRRQQSSNIDYNGFNYQPRVKKPRESRQSQDSPQTRRSIDDKRKDELEQLVSDMKCCSISRAIFASSVVDKLTIYKTLQTEHFNRFADAGKRTAINIFSKVKSKIQDFDTKQNPGST
jgi:hypothetical protein